MIHRIRPAESSDFAWLLKLRQTSAQRHVEEVFGAWDVAAQRARFTRAFGAEAMAVVEVEAQPVGALSVDWDADPIVLAAVELHPRWQGRGLGTRLVHDVLRRATQLERGVVTTVLRPNPVQALYERLGIHVAERTATHVTLRWQPNIRAEVTLAAAMAPWADPGRRRAWARRLFDLDPEPEVELAQFIAGRHGLSSTPQVLDLGAGAGRRLRPLAALGWSVTAAEPDPDLRAACARVGAMAARPVEVGEAVPTAQSGSRFDLVLAFDGALWRPEHAGRVALARQLRSIMRPGAVLVAEGPNAPWVLHSRRDLPPRTQVFHRAAISSIPAEHFDFHRGEHQRRQTFVADVDGQEVAEWTETERLGLVDLPALRLALDAAGFAPPEVFHDLSATAVGCATGPRLLVAAQPR